MLEFAAEGLGTMVFEAIRGGDMSNRPLLYKNILLSGGTTMLPGFPDRLKADIIQSWISYVRRNPDTADNAPVNVIAPPRRHINVYTGATVFAKTVEGRSEELISKKEYDEKGKLVIQQKAWSKKSLQ